MKKRVKSKDDCGELWAQGVGDKIWYSCPHFANGLWVAKSWFCAECQTQINQTMEVVAMDREKGTVTIAAYVTAVYESKDLPTPPRPKKRRARAGAPE